jgi:hypothetical protein
VQPFRREEPREHEHQATQHATNNRLRLDSRASVKRTIYCGYPTHNLSTTGGRSCSTPSPKARATPV